MNRIVNPSATERTEVEVPVKPAEAHGLLHEMIRSFTTLARTLNLSHAVKELGSTRQTVRRHIAQLEEAKGVKLFRVQDRQYHLTEAGERALPDALDILARGQAWLTGRIESVDGLRLCRVDMPGGWKFYMQQKPMTDIWASERPLLRETLRAWAVAGGELEHPALAHVRPFFMVYRKTPNGWVFVELGEESSFVSWFGWARARSSIGCETDRLPSADSLALLLTEPFDDVVKHQGARLEHVFTALPRGEDNARVPISYKRLLLGGRFPDGTFALIAVIDRSKDIQIEGLDPFEASTMPDELIMTQLPEELKYEH